MRVLLLGHDFLVPVPILSGREIEGTLSLLLTGENCSVLHR